MGRGLKEVTEQARQLYEERVFRVENTSAKALRAVCFICLRNNREIRVARAL